MDRPKPPTRPPELQDWLNLRLYHPLSWRLARMLAPTAVTPNMVSITGCGVIAAAAACYTLLPWPLSVALGLTLHLFWHVVDGADGDLARMTGRTSPLGEVIDGVCDYVGHILLYVALTIALSGAIGAGPAWLLAIAAGAAHVVQTNHAESQKRMYQWWAYGVPWLRQSRGAGHGGGFFQTVSRWYLRLAEAMNRSADAVDARIAAATGDPARLERMRAAVRRRGPAMLLGAKLTGPNPRAWLLGIAMLAGDARWFFLAEIVLMDAALLWSVARQRRINRELAAELARV